MKTDFTDVTVVLDRSGSMADCRSDAEGGLNTFIEEQKKQPGECVFSLVEFDDRYDFVHRGVPIAQVQPYSLVPRGMTALLDAVGRAINETGERLAAMNEEERPSLVVFVIITDGQENSSREFTKAQIKDMIERQTRDYNWQFTFLGADQDSFSEAQSLGIAASAAANYSKKNAKKAFEAASANVVRMREAAKNFGLVENKYSDDEREAMDK